MDRSVPFDCPICGGRVPAKAKACPHCGACDKTGWKEDADLYDGLDLPDEQDFNYDEFVQKEFGAESGLPKLSWFWKVTTVVLLILTIVLIVTSSLFYR